MDESISGEEALAWGALQAGIEVVRGYPGSPGTGVLERLLGAEGVDVQWSVNEKVACEFCWGAAIAGKRALFCTKSLGLNVALDTLTTVNLVGTRAGMVILTGDDPSAYRSQNEEDSRHFGPLLELPMLEPRTVQEAGPLMEAAFRLSERWELPVLIRITRGFAFHRERLSPRKPPHRRRVGEPVNPAQERPQRRWIASTQNVLPRRRRLHEKLDALAAELATSRWWNRTGPSDAPVGILAAGFMATKVQAVLQADAFPGPWELMALAPVYPFPETAVRDFLVGKERVLVVEEVDPIVERAVRVTAQRFRLSVEILGKEAGPFPRAGELLARELIGGLSRFFGVPAPDPTAVGAFTEPPLSKRPRVPLVRDGFCPGCPYVPTFAALEAVLRERGESGVVLADPGCAVRLMVQPVGPLDVKISMGSCVAIGAGIARAHPGVRVVACPGDSGFFHSALLGLVDAALHRVPMVVLVLDNRTTALSGCQPSPTTGRDAQERPAPLLLPETFARACGVSHVSVFDPADPEATRRAFQEAFAARTLAVLVMRSPCVLLEEESCAPTGSSRGGA